MFQGGGWSRPMARFDSSGVFSSQTMDKHTACRLSTSQLISSGSALTMNFQSKITVILSLFLTTLLASKGVSQDGEIHALLVGVTKYTHLSNAQQLDGPINDVKLVSETLIERYESAKGELEKRIVMLHEGQPDELKPTYANIAREFAAIADRVSDGDQVFILLSGHVHQMFGKPLYSAAIE